jgi:hypothetical protein
LKLDAADGYGSRGLRLTSTLASVAKSGATVVAFNVGGESDVKSNGLAHSYAHWAVCTSHLSFPAALQAWASSFRGIDSSNASGKPDSSGFAAAELMSAGEAIEDVWDKKYGGFFTNLDAQLNEERRVFVKDGGKESGGGVIEIDIAFVMDCTYVELARGCFFKTCNAFCTLTPSHAIALIPWLPQRIDGLIHCRRTSVHRGHHQHRPKSDA